MVGDAELGRRQADGKPDQLRQMQNRHAEFGAEIAFHLVLESVEHGVTQRTGRDDGGGAVVPRRLDMPAGELDRNLLLVRRGVKTAALGAAAIVDRLAAENFVDALDRAGVARRQQRGGGNKLRLIRS